MRRPLAPGDGEPRDGEPGDGAPGDGEPGDGEPGDGEPRGAEARGVASRAPWWRARWVADGLVAVGWSALTVSAAVELVDADAVLELISGAVAAVAFLTATLLRRGRGDLALRARLLLGAGAATLLALVGLWQANLGDGRELAVLLLPDVLLFAVAVQAMREARTEQDRSDRQALRARLAGEEAERRRWVAELHDGTLQELAAVELALGGAAAGRGPQEVLAGVAHARALVRHQIGALRHLIHRMRPLALDTLGLAAALEDLARRAEEASGARVAVNVARSLPRLPPGEEVSAYRVVQEALNNAVRHADAASIVVGANVAGDELRLSVTDDGVGMPPARGAAMAGYGLQGMRERAMSLGAVLEVTPAPGGGTRVELRIPLHPR